MARGRGGARTHKQWAGTQTGTPVALTTTQAAIITFSTDISETVLRSRGEILIVGNPNAAADNEVVAMGLAVVSDEAVAVGGAALPSPIASPDFDWFWFHYVLLQDLVSVVPTPDSIGMNARVTIDSKAMRKASPNHSVVLIAELATGEMSAVNMTAGLRILSSI